MFSEKAEILSKPSKKLYADVLSAKRHHIVEKIMALKLEKNGVERFIFKQV